VAEMIIPGTYIDVRSEGLISAGRIATGVVGVIGTASSGPVGVPITLASFANARDIFGLPDDLGSPEDGSNPLTLVRALQQVYNNGASGVIAVRVAGSTRANATFALRDSSDRTVATLTAASPGTWANDMAIKVENATEDCLISGESVPGPFNALRYSGVVPSPQNRLQIKRGTTRQTENKRIVYKRILKNITVAPNTAGRFLLPETPVENVPTSNELRVLAADNSLVRRYGEGAILLGPGAPPAANEVRITAEGELIFEASQVPTATQRVVATYAVGHIAPVAGEVLLTVWDGTLAFATGEAPNQANGDTLTATYLIDREKCVRVSLISGTTVERYTTPDGRQLEVVMARSSLATAAADGGTNGTRKPANIESFFGTGSNRAGNNGASATGDDYAGGLEKIAEMIVNIVVLAGQNASTMGDKLLGHLNSTAETDHERIGVIGAGGATVPEFLGHNMASDRIVLVAPGIRSADGQVLPSAYTAAAVAGLMSSVPVQTSLTNRPLTIPGLAPLPNRGQQEQLIQRSVLTVVEKEGFRVLKGVTTHGQGNAFSAIPTRRIVDYAKYGVRSAANSYIGRLNNDRVRAALKATLDAFLTRMVEDEALTGYDLEVTATRAQEIAGEVSVIMTLKPTFSIEYIRVVMVLK
jgi:hypothetical protein